MSDRTYWLNLFTVPTWKEFQDAGAQVSGFRESRWSAVQKLNIGDYLLWYLAGVSRFVGVFSVTSAAFKDTTPRWKEDTFPCRVKVTEVIALTPETAVPVQTMRDDLSVFKDLKNPTHWTGHFRGSPVKWTQADGEAVVKALTQAHKSPVARPIDERKLREAPKAYQTKNGSVTVPDSDEATTAQIDVPTEARAHTEIQWLLGRLGRELGLQVWIARNDRGREFNGNRFSDLTSPKTELPHQFNEATTKTIEMIDVLWLRSNAIVAAFEIESTTSIYSGLLRMSDLVAMQPNLNIPLYLVAPDEREAKVQAEVNRPTFSHLQPPLAHMCRFISFSALRGWMKDHGNVVKYMTPSFLQDVSQSCELQD